MSWLDLEGHDHVLSQFRARMQRGRLGSSFLFVGPEGIGKRSFALRLAQSLLCPTGRETLVACLHCPSCQQVAASTHPDLMQVSRPEDRTMIPIEAFIGDREHRMREGLCPWISRKPTEGSRRVAIIDDADDISPEAANSLLKTLEEPPPKSVLILVGSSPQRQLPTIRSRCQLVRFDPLPEEILLRLLVREGIPQAQSAEVIRWSGGSLARARRLADPSILEFRDKWYGGFRDSLGSPSERTRTLQAFVDEVGKELAPRRARLEIVIELTLDLFRQALRRSCQVPLQTDESMARIVEEFVGSWTWGHEGLAACVDRSLIALRHLDANANVATNLETWLDDLTRIARLGPHAVALRP